MTKPTALDPNVRISTDEFSTNIKVSGSLGGDNIKVGETKEIFGAGVVKSKFVDETDLNNPESILSNTNVTGTLFSWNTGTLLENSPTDYANEVRIQENALNNLTRRLETEPENTFVIDQIETVKQNILDNELSEIYSIGEIAQKDFLGDKSKGWALSPSP